MKFVAVVFTTAWAATTATEWMVLPNHNAFPGGVANTTGVIDAGKTATWEKCQAVAEQRQASVFAWAGDGDCLLKNDGDVFQPTVQTGSVSGLLAEWNVLPGQNAVWDTVANSTPGILDGGKTATWQDCQAVARQHNVTIFTWHDENQGGFANDCWLRDDFTYTPHGQSGHTTGVFGYVPPSQDDFDCAYRKFAYVLLWCPRAH